MRGRGHRESGRAEAGGGSDSRRVADCHMARDLGSGENVRQERYEELQDYTNKNFPER
jgi:hypothetical protein